MGYTSPILEKERKTKILFQSLVSELKKKCWGKQTTTKQKAIYFCLRLVIFLANKASASLLPDNTGGELNCV